MDEKELLEFNASQPQMNMIIMQLLLEVNSRQMVLQNLMAVHLAEGKDWDVNKILAQIEKDATAYRLDFVSSLYAQFGNLPPDISDLLKKPPDQSSS